LVLGQTNKPPLRLPRGLFASSNVGRFVSSRIASG
jgi:hypothetical protein